MELYLPVFAALFVTAYGCSAPGRDRPDAPLEEKIYKSQFVAYGTVLETFPDPVYSEKDVYAAAVSVKCTYKGGMLPINVTVVGAGKMPRCPEVNLHKMTDYILLLKSRTDKYYDVEFGPMTGDPQMIDEILIVCDLALVYTKGSDAEKNDDCPEIFEDVQTEENCLRYNPPQNNATFSTQSPNITTKDTVIKSYPDGEPEPEPEPDIKINDSDKSESKSMGNGKRTGQSAISDNGNGKELYSLSGFLLFTCTSVATFLL
ncbi:hypothetical protein CHS0354_000343 [Potamilus streckersoni]|uniref:Uncharacterized protein n=1 Tax=Potamilus streckersoni TaxID=2493646 RepID=A0AAE0T5W2_9BIVA|nr:hypothetical protein CHS0354_000343 [Potamilus streckersoni]